MNYLNEEINLFVPGRLSIVGELSDWVCDYKDINKSIVCGEAIAAGIDKGIYATVKRSDNFVFHMDDETFEIEMDNIKLNKVVQSESFFSYVCAVALYMNKNYDVGGIDINIRCMTLPMKKGLSSSAAISVLVAKSFNLLYDLGLEFYELMKIAYESEHLALSKYGRLDQICAKGLGLSHLVFNKDSLDINQVKLKSRLYFVIADLNGKKDTKKILSSLHSCFPFPKNVIEEKVKYMLCEGNKKIVEEAIKALNDGDNEKLGNVMNYSQRLIDESAGMICDELKAPILHKIMEDKNVIKWSYGSKGIGSNGDGSIEILAKNEKCQREIEEYLQEKYGMNTFSCNFNPTHKIKKAVIPVAGFGTRMYPFTRNVKKAFLPIVEDGYIKPTILKLVEELDEAGIEEIALIIAKDEEPIYNDFFRTPISEEHFNKLNDKAREYELKIQRLGEKISYIVQEEQLGYGHAVYLSKEFAAGEPVLMILGDTIYKSKTDKSCTEQMLEYYDKVEKPIISLHPIKEEDFKYYGIANGIYDNFEKTEISLQGIVEKPSIEFARENLNMDGKYFGTFGESIIDSSIYDALEYNIKNNVESKGEFQYTDAVDIAIKNADIKGFIINGKQYDLGNAKAYQQAMIDYPIDFTSENEIINESEKGTNIFSITDVLNKNLINENNDNFDYTKISTKSLNNVEEYKV